MNGDRDEHANEMPAARRTSLLAVAGLVSSLVAPFIGTLASIGAIALNAIAWRQIARQDHLRGVTLAAIGLVIASGTVLLAPAIRNAREAARRNTANCLMKQLGLAMHNYRDVYKSFPPQAIVDDQGRPLLSWRVLLLPYIGHADLYEQFHLDEPWDSPHNIRLLSRVPESLQGPRSAGGTKTNYLLPVGKGVVYSGPDAVTSAQIADGISNTFMIVEADNPQAVNWSEPKDLAYNSADPAHGLGELWAGGFNVANWDGSVRFIASDTDPGVLRAAFDPADGRRMYEGEDGRWTISPASGAGEGKLVPSLPR